MTGWPFGGYASAGDSEPSEVTAIAYPPGRRALASVATLSLAITHLADDLQETLHCQLPEPLGFESVLPDRDHLRDLACRFENVLDPLVIVPTHELEVDRLIQDLLIPALETACRHDIN